MIQPRVERSATLGFVIASAGGDLDCSYYTQAQCRASLSGMSGYCIENPWLSYPREEWLKWTGQRPEPEPKRKARKRRQTK